MSDRFKDLPESQQRIEMMRRNGENFRDAAGNWLANLGDDPSSALVRAIWDDEPDDPEPCSPEDLRPLPKGSAA